MFVAVCRRPPPKSRSGRVLSPASSLLLVSFVWRDIPTTLGAISTPEECLFVIFEETIFRMHNPPIWEPGNLPTKQSKLEAWISPRIIFSTVLSLSLSLSLLVFHNLEQDGDPYKRRDTREVRSRCVRISADAHPRTDDRDLQFVSYKGTRSFSGARHQTMLSPSDIRPFLFGPPRYKSNAGISWGNLGAAARGTALSVACATVALPTSKNQKLTSLTR